MELLIKRINDSAIMPTRGSEQAAGIDLYANLGSDIIEIDPGERVRIGTGLCFSIPTGHFGAVFARSGIAAKRGLRPSNCVGVIDSDYRGEVQIMITNDSSQVQLIQNGERIAQMVVMPYRSVEMVEVDELTKTDRGEGGFGSTGTM